MVRSYYSVGNKWNKIKVIVLSYYINYINKCLNFCEKYICEGYKVLWIF